MTGNVSRVQRNSKVSVWNLPNALTVARLVSVPVFIILALQDSWAMRWASFAVFALAAITDRFDGHLARSWNQITDFGRIVDPIADKALTLCGFAVASWLVNLPWWVTILIAVRELGITAMRAVFLRRGVVVSASQAGKLKTFMQIMALGVLLIPWGYFLAMDQTANEWWVVMMIRFGWALAGVALALTLYSGIVYVIDGVRIMRATSASSGDDDSGDDEGEKSSTPLAGQHVQA